MRLKDKFFDKNDIEKGQYFYKQNITYNYSDKRKNPETLKFQDFFFSFFNNNTNIEHTASHLVECNVIIRLI